MPCSHAGSGRRDRDRGGSRREFMRAAVAIGGMNALSACLGLEQEEQPGPAAVLPSDPEVEVDGFPTGPEDLSTLPASQHHWQDYMVYTRFGNTAFPQHQTLLFADYAGDETPTDGEREEMDAAFRSLERAFQRGTGGDRHAITYEGLLFTVSYSPTYFERYDEPLPDDLDLPKPEAVIEELGEEETEADHHEVMIHLLSGSPSVVLAAEQALFGRLDEINGVEMAGDLSGILEPTERRTGFSERGIPAKKYDEERIPDDAPLSMGFRAGFVDQLPAEKRITLRSGPFEGGATQQVSQVHIDLERWYDTTEHEDRVELIYSPDHEPDQVGRTGEALGATSGKTPETVERIPEHVRTKGRLGHGQKLAKARDDSFLPTILRRDCNMNGRPGIHFNSWHRGVSDFVETRKAMNAEEFTADLEEGQSGILDFLDVTTRATYLIPPRAQLAFPTPTGE